MTSIPASAASSSGSNRSATPSEITAIPSSRPSTACRFSIAPSIIFTTSSTLITGSGNSSGMMLSAVPAELPIPSARCPALRPITITTYQRFVVRLSRIRFCTSCVPRCRAVSKPNVGMSPGSGKSLSIVLGMCATRTAPPDAFATSAADSAVSSPPIEASRVMPSSCSVLTHVRRCSGLRVGLAREVRRIAPPSELMNLTSDILRGMTCSALPSMRWLNPSRMPYTSAPLLSASSAQALMALLMPGAGPPPTRMPSLTFPAFIIPPFASAHHLTTAACEVSIFGATAMAKGYNESRPFAMMRG